MNSRNLTPCPSMNDASAPPLMAYYSAYFLINQFNYLLKVAIFDVKMPPYSFFFYLHYYYYYFVCVFLPKYVFSPNSRFLVCIPLPSSGCQFELINCRCLVQIHPCLISSTCSHLAAVLSLARVSATYNRTVFSILSANKSHLELLQQLKHINNLTRSHFVQFFVLFNNFPPSY